MRDAFRTIHTLGGGAQRPRPALRETKAFAFFVACLAGGLFLAPPASADTLVMRDGKILRGVRIIERQPGGDLSVVISGSQVATLPAERYILATSQDVVALADGRFFEGEIVMADSFEVALQTKGGLETFARSAVKEIVRSDGDSGGGADEESGSAGFPSAVASLSANNPVEALEFLSDYASDSTADISGAEDILRRAVEMIHAQTRRHLREGRLNEANALSAGAGDALGASLDLARAFPGGLKEYTRFVQGFNRLQARAYIDAAQPIIDREDVNRYPLAGQMFWRSNEISPSFEALTGTAEMLVRLDRVKPRERLAKNEKHPADLLLKARELAESAGSDAPDNWKSRWQRAWLALNRKEQEFGLAISADPRAASSVAALATPTPAPTPLPVINVSAPLVSTPAPPPKPSSTPQVDAFLKNYVYPVWNGLDGWSRRNFPFGAGALLGIVAAFVAFNWGLALWLLEKRVRDADFLAQRWKPFVKAVGLPAFALYMAKAAAARKKVPAGSKCDSCGKVIENIDLYENYAFDRCPHCKSLIEPLYTLEDYLQHLLTVLERTSAEQSGLAPGAMSMDKATRDAMQKLIRSIVTLGIRRRASDVHIEPDVEGAKVRMRIDGVLYDMLSVPPSIMNALISAIKVMAVLDIAEKRVPQDGKIALRVDGVEVDIRVNTAPQQVGERVSMRLLDSRSIKVESTKLGMEGRNLEAFEQIIRRPAGVIYLTGPTGSGKTTTLYVALNTVNDGRKNIVTIEDPIEYQLKGINQMQVNPAQGFTFASGLRSILRGDPDVIMIGEVRDKETAEIGVDAASTGHLVFTTLHTIDAASVVARLFDLGVEPRRVSSSLLASIAQRLVRVNCPECKKPYHPTPVELKQLGMKDEDIERTTFYKGFGCEACQGTGFQGRIGLFEMFVPDESIKEMIESGGSPALIREMARKRGMTTLREEGILRVTQGTAMVDEVLRAT